MLKLLFWILVGGALYFFYQSRERLTARQKEEHLRGRSAETIDVEAEEITEEEKSA